MNVVLIETVVYNCWC